MNGNITNVGMAVQLFNNPEFGNIRILIIEDAPWFVGRDVAVALGYSVARKAIYDHVDDEDKRGFQIGTPSGQQEMTIINESGMYSLVMSSKLESAKRFKRWVTNEVLPSIRKTGSYGKGASKTITPEEFAKLTAIINKLDNRLDTVVSMLKGLQAGSQAPAHPSHPTQAGASTIPEKKSPWRKEMYRYATAIAAHKGIKVSDVYTNIYDVLWRDYTWSRRYEKQIYAQKWGIDDLRTVSNLDAIEDSSMYKSIFDCLMRDLYVNTLGVEVECPKVGALCAPPNQSHEIEVHAVEVEAEANEGNASNQEAAKEAIERTVTAGRIAEASAIPNTYTKEQALEDLETARKSVYPIVSMTYHPNVMSGMVNPLAKLIGDESAKKSKTYRCIYKKYGRDEVKKLTRAFRRSVGRNPCCTTEVFYRSARGLDSFKEAVKALILEQN